MKLNYSVSLVCSSSRKHTVCERVSREINGVKALYVVDVVVDENVRRKLNFFVKITHEQQQQQNSDT